LATIEQNIAQIRRRLGSPDQDAPDDPLIYEVLESQIQHHLNQLSTTRGEWSVDSCVITPGAGDEDLLITAKNFGRPFWVHTVDDDDPAHVRRDIEFSFLSEIDERYRGPQQTSSELPHTAQTMSFYRKPNAWYVRVAPKPSAPGAYRIWYETGIYVCTTLKDQPGLTPFHHLIRAEAAVALLPYCKWGAISFADPKTLAHWEARAASLAQPLLLDVAKFQKQFDVYRQNSTREQMTTREGYGDDYESEYLDLGYGIGTLD
jgi:hypothetical protein